MGLPEACSLIPGAEMMVSVTNFKFLALTCNSLDLSDLVLNLCQNKMSTRLHPIVSDLCLSTTYSKLVVISILSP